jgi:hypothetical protein
MLPKITMTVTSCRRYNLLERTIKSFFDCCLDADYIEKIILVDDNSDPDDLYKINLLLKSTNKPYILIHKSEQLKGHTESLNILYDLVKTDFMLHCEDDWEFRIKDNFITKAFNIMATDNSIKQFLFRTNSDLMATGQITEITKDGIEYIKYNYVGQHARNKKNAPAWSGWCLNPALWKFSDIKTLGKFVPDKSNFEYDHSRKFWKNGFKVAYFPKNICEHIGEGNSSYKLNDTKK